MNESTSPGLHYSAEDLQWLRDTVLKGIPLPVRYHDFQSFVIWGNEDCPDAVDLFNFVNPDYDALHYRITFKRDAPVYCEGSEA